tara:strand:+ start:1705 stop:2718 length:1014 start_codon:yes stop_codon:yes gene_type:complete
MKVIAIGDPHFKTSNILDVEKFIDRIQELASNEQPDIIVILGDLLHEHERLHTTPLNKAYEFVRKMSEISKTYVIVGNHDLINNQQFLTQNHWMNAMKDWDNVTVIDDVLVEHNFLFCPYVPNGRFMDAISKYENWKECQAIFCHQEFKDCKMGAIISEHGDEWDESYPPVIAGHIHSNQTIKNVYYPGSSMQHAFGESDKNVIPLITFNDDDRNYELNEIDLDLPRKHIIYKEVSDVDNIKIPENDDQYKLTLSGNSEEFKTFKKSNKYKELTKKGIKVVYKPKKKDNQTLSDIPDDINFSEILHKLILNEKNGELLTLFNHVVYDKDINEDMIVI